MTKKSPKSGEIISFKRKARQVDEALISSRNKFNAAVHDIEVEAPPGSGKKHQFRISVPPGVKQDQYLDGVKHRLERGVLGFKKDEDGNNVKDVRQLKRSFREGFRAASFYLQAERKRQHPDSKLQAYKFKHTAEGDVKGLKQMDYEPGDLDPELYQRMVKRRPGL